MSNVTSESVQDMPQVIKIDEDKVHQHLNRVVRQSVEDTLNQMLDAEADRLCNAKRYERSTDRADTRAGHYTRQLLTTSGKVSLKVPKLRSLPFETQIIERYRRRESSVEEALIEMYLAGVSVRRIEDITEALWGIPARRDPSTVSELNQKVYEQIEAWRNKPITGEHPYVYLDGICLKRSWGGEVRNVSVLIAIGVASDGFREVLGICEGAKEDKEGWLNFVRQLKARGLQGVKLFISDKCLGLVESLGEVYAEASWQRCVVHWYRNVLSLVPKGKSREVTAMLKAMHGQEDRGAALRKGQEVVEKLRQMKLSKAAELVSESMEETLSYMSFPREHWIVSVRPTHTLDSVEQ